MVDLSAKTVTDEELERFAEEFCKHEELLKPVGKTTKDKLLRTQALVRLGATLGVRSSKEMAQRVAKFRSLCISKMRWLIRVAHARYGTGADALVIAPAWLRRLDLPFNLMISALRMESADEGPQAALGARSWRFSWTLFLRVRAALRAAPPRERPALLRRCGALDELAGSLRVPAQHLHDIWRRMCEAALRRLRGSARRGDLRSALRPTPLDWQVIDLALLYDARQRALAEVSFCPPEVEALLQLYTLIVDAYTKFGKKAFDSTEVTPHEPDAADPAEPGRCDSGAPTGTTPNSANTEAAAPQHCEWESAELWDAVHAEYTRRGRVASLVTLQRRWHELRARARRALLRSWGARAHAPHPLLLAVARRFPHAVTRRAPRWPELVRAGRVHTRDVVCETSMQTPLADVPSTISMNEVIEDLMDWSDDEPEIIEPKKEVIEIDSDAEIDTGASCGKRASPAPSAANTEPHDHNYAKRPPAELDDNSVTASSEITVKSERLNDGHEIPRAPATNETINNSAQAQQQHSAVTNASSTPAVKSERISESEQNTKTNLEVTSETNAQTRKLRIMFEDDADLDEIDNLDADRDDPSDDNDNNINDVSNENENIRVKSEKVTENDASVNRASGSKENAAQLIDDSVDKELAKLAFKRSLIENYYKKVRRDCFKHNATDEAESTEAGSSDQVLEESDALEHIDRCSDDNNSEDNNTIDEKLLQLPLVALLPLERSALWRAHARDGSINCRRVSVRRLAAAPALSDREVLACRRYVPPPPPPPPPAERRAGVARAKIDELRGLPRTYKELRRSLTARLRLPRTALSRAFWCSARNMAQLYVCRPCAVRAERLPARRVKRVELPDIADVRRINGALLTAQVAPITARPPPTAAWAAPTTARDAPTAARAAPTTARDAPTAARAAPTAARAAPTAARDAPTTARDASAAAQAASDGEPEAEEFTLDAASDLSGEEEWEAAAPSHADLMRMIRTLVHPSAAAMRECEARRRRRRDAIARCEDALLQRQRDDARRLQRDIRALLDRLAASDEDAKDRPSVKRVKASKKAPAPKLDDSDRPLPDALQEWRRQKTLVHKFFHFTPRPEGGAGAEPQDGDKIDSSAETIISDDEDLPQKDKTDNDAKRAHPGDDADDTNKRVKLTEDDDENDGSNDEGACSDDDDDRLLIIDEGIRDFDDPAPHEPAPPDARPTPAPRLTIVPVDSVPGLADANMASNVVYVVKTHKKDVAPPALPEDAAVTRNPPPTTIDAKLPTYYFIQSGRQVRGNSEFKVVSGPPLKSILRKSASASGVRSKNTISTTESRTSKPPATYQNARPSDAAAATRPGPLSYKHKIKNQISKASESAKSNEETPQQNIIEEIDLTDDTEDDATGASVRPQIVHVASLAQIKREKDNTPLTSSAPSEDKMLCLEVGPIESHFSTNIRTYANTRALAATSKTNVNANKHSAASGLNQNNSLNNNSALDNNGENVETVHLDSECSRNYEANVELTAVKKEPDADVCPPDDAEAADVDVESPLPSKSTPSVAEGASKAKPHNRSLLKSSQVRANGAAPQPTKEYRPKVGRTPKTVPPNENPTAPSQKENTDNIPIKITSATTSKDLLKLSPEELARLLEVDNDYEEVVYDAAVAPAPPAPPSVAPIQIKKEKGWAEELQRSREEGSGQSAGGAAVKREPAAGEEEEAEGAEAEEWLADIPTAYVLRGDAPDLICGDVTPDDEEEVYFRSVADLGRREIDVGEYVDLVPDPEEPILRCDFSAPLWLLGDKYMLLTDESAPCEAPAFLSVARARAPPPYTLLRFPHHAARHRQVLDLGIKKGRDVMVCGCGGAGSCVLCASVAGAAEFTIHKPKFKKPCRACGVDPSRERARIYSIRGRAYRSIGEAPLKFVAVEGGRACRVCGDAAAHVARPDALLINDKHYERTRARPLAYAPVLSAVQAAARGARLARREAELYVLNLRTARRRRLLYRGDARLAAFAAAVRAAMAQLDREERDAWYRRRVDRGDAR